MIALVKNIILLLFIRKPCDLYTYICFLEPKDSYFDPFKHQSRVLPQYKMLLSDSSSHFKFFDRFFLRALHHGWWHSFPGFWWLVPVHSELGYCIHRKDNDYGMMTESLHNKVRYKNDILWNRITIQRNLDAITNTLIQETQTFKTYNITPQYNEKMLRRAKKKHKGNPY